MTNDGRFSIWVGLLVLVCAGCRHPPATDQPSRQALLPLIPDQVAYIIVGDEKSDAPLLVETNAISQVTQISPFHEFFRITDRRQIERCTEELNKLRGHQDGRMTLSGILSSQIYVSRMGDVLAFATIICGYSTVLVNKDAVLRDGRAFTVDPTLREWASASQPEYALEILRLMKELSPAEIERREKECRDMGTNLRAYMGLPDQAK